MQLVEQEFDVHSLRCGDVHVWPLVRIALYEQLFRPEVALIRENPGYAGHRLGVAGGTPRFTPESYTRIPEEPALYGEGPDSCDLLFVTRPVEHHDRLGSAWFNRTVDPLIEIAQDRHRCAKLEVLRDGGVTSLPRVEPTLFLRADEFIAARQKCERERPELAPLEIRNFGAFQRFLQGILPQLSLPESHFLGLLHEVDHYTGAFLHVLERLRPRAVFLVCYYNTIGMGLLLACQRLGIRTVELQHGIQWPYNVAYCHWGAVPDGGYALLPDRLWVWGPGAQQQIDPWFPLAGEPHGSIVGGHPWLGRWLEGDVEVHPERTGFLDQCASHERVILVTLQGIPDPVPDLLLQALQRSPGEWLWLLRTHPVAREPDPDALRSLLQTRGITNAEIENATALPVHALLRRATHHVTCYSSTSHEALSFGVPTALIHRVGFEYYAPYIEAGVFNAAPDADALLDFVRRSPQSFPLREPVPYIDPSVDRARAALDAMAGTPRVATPSSPSARR